MSRGASLLATTALCYFCVCLVPSIDSSVREIAAPTEQAAADPAQTAEKRTSIGVNIANVRAGPSTTTVVVTTLPRDTEVTPVERRGKWVLIRLGSGDGTHPPEGWVHGSALTEPAEP